MAWLGPAYSSPDPLRRNYWEDTLHVPDLEGGFETEQATTGVRKLVQIYNMCASVSACVSVTNLCYNFPQENLAMKPTYQDCKNPMKPKKTKKNQDCKTHETKKTKNKKKHQDCKTHESSNLGTLGSDILVFFGFFGFLGFFCFLGFFGFPCLGQQYHPKMHKKNPLCTRSLFNLVFDGLSTPTENC